MLEASAKGTSHWLRSREKALNHHWVSVAILRDRERRRENLNCVWVTATWPGLVRLSVVCFLFRYMFCPELGTPELRLSRRQIKRRPSTDYPDTWKCSFFPAKISYTSLCSSRHSEFMHSPLDHRSLSPPHKVSLQHPRQIPSGLWLWFSFRDRLLA